MTPVQAARRHPEVVAGLLAAAGLAWWWTAKRMAGMDAGPGISLGTPGRFIGPWVVMMAAMMLPGAIPAVLRLRCDSAPLGRAAVFLGSYLVIWALVGVVVYALYRPHGTSLAGAVVVAAGVYEVTPVKHHCRRRCRESVDSGFGFGAYCVGSGIGLMSMMAALGVMSVTWMPVIAVVLFGQKLVGARAVIDVPLALAIVAFGVLIIVDPSPVPGLTPPM